MCGIAGIIRWDGQPVFEHEIRSMCGMMVHRGPDDEGIYVGGGVGLGMRRLSIIDLEGGQQPVLNEDGSVWVVFNGEIYNYRELRRSSSARGHTFRTDSDTETIVHLYEDYGARCVDQLRGMFAFAIWDIAAQAAAAGPRSPGHQAALLRGDATAAGVRLRAEADPARCPRSIAPSTGRRVSHLFTFLATPAVAEHRRRREEARAGAPRGGRARLVAADRALLGRRVRARRDVNRRRAGRAAARAARRVRRRSTRSATCRSARS